MADAIFDGANLHITLPSTGSFDAQTDIYSAWKEWVALSDNAKYPPAFDTTGGDDVGSGQKIAPYFFCRNDLGWKIKMPSQDGEIVVSGNLFPRNSNLSLFEQTSGYDAFLRLEVSTRAVVIETGTSGLTPSESSQLQDVHKRLDLDSGTPNTYANDNSQISNNDFTLSRSDNGNGTFTVNRT
tara:strand:- start:661 stop:1209 length:549 start_codon:yes stop_codon:yes gene_type:complete